MRNTNLIFVLCLFLFGNWVFNNNKTQKNSFAKQSYYATSLETTVFKPHKKFRSSTDEVVLIKIYSQQKVNSFFISSENGSYSVWANGKEITNTTNTKVHSRNV